MWPRTEVVERANGHHHAAKRAGERRLGSVRVMHFAVDQVLVNRRVEGSFRLRGSAVEADPGAAARRNYRCEALLTQPRRSTADIAWADSEALGILFRREPLVIVRRRRIELLLQQHVQIVLLLRR